MADCDFIELTFKSPSDRTVPHTLKCKLSWSIFELKQNLVENYPCKPTIDSQKIIYSGKLLKNDQLLSDVFRGELSAIVHFICQPTVVIKDEKEIKPEQKTQQELYKEYENYLKTFYNNQAENFANMAPYQQMMWWNQMYMQSYYQQFQNNVQEVRQREINSDPTAIQQGDNSSRDNNQRQQQDNRAGVEPIGNAVAAAAAFNGIGAAAGADNNINDNADGEPRDILHYFYIMVRLGLLLVVCYYYSSLFSILVTFMLFMLFVGVNILRRNHPLQTPAPSVPVPTENNAAAITNEEGASTNGETVQSDEDKSAALTPGNNNIASNQSTTNPTTTNVVDKMCLFAQTLFQFVLAFFLTLFPEPVVDIDPN